MMKRVMMASVLLLTVSTAAMSAIRPETFSLTPFFGGYSFDGKQHLETRPVVGLRGGYNLTDRIGVEALFDYTPTKGTVNGRDTSVFNYGVGVLYHILPMNTLVPFITAGYGGLTVDQEGSSSVTKGAFNYGAGAKYALSRSMELRGEIRHIIFKDNETLSNVEYGIGLGFLFGGVRPVVMAVAPPVEQEAPKAAPLVVAPPPPPPPAPEPSPAPAPPPPPAPKASLAVTPASIEQGQSATPPPPPPPPEPEPEKLTMVLNVQFDTAKADIKKQYHEEIGRVAEFLKTYPTVTGVIEGHTDNAGSAEMNMKLSQKRADSVRKYLLDNYGIDPARLTAKGYGLTRPIADNKTPEGMQKNRRIQAQFETVVKKQK